MISYFFVALFFELSIFTNCSLALKFQISMLRQGYIKLKLMKIPLLKFPNKSAKPRGGFQKYFNDWAMIDSHSFLVSKNGTEHFGLTHFPTFTDDDDWNVVKVLALSTQHADKIFLLVFSSAFIRPLASRSVLAVHSPSLLEHLAFFFQSSYIYFLEWQPLLLGMFFVLANDCLSDVVSLTAFSEPVRSPRQR